MIKLGDATIPYHEDFKLYITTKLPNPHYTPEVSVKVTLINFTLSPSGLEDQMLGCVVAEERPDLEEAKNQLIISNAIMKNELKELEDTILFRLSKSENPVDDIELINALEASKSKSAEIKVGHRIYLFISILCTINVQLLLLLRIVQSGDCRANRKRHRSHT